MSIYVSDYADPNSDGDRPPDWRWQLSRADVPRRFRIAADDDWCRRLADYRDQSDPLQNYDDIVAANALLDGDPLRLAEIEARILANEPVETIAHKCQLPVSTVVAYEAVFFDVRRRLSALFWVAIYAFDDRSPDKLRELWKRFGYRFGSGVIDMLTAGADRSRLLEVGVDAYQEPECRLSEFAKAIIAHYCELNFIMPMDIFVLLVSHGFAACVQQELKDSLEIDWDSKLADVLQTQQICCPH